MLDQPTYTYQNTVRELAEKFAPRAAKWDQTREGVVTLTLDRLLAS